MIKPEISIDQVLAVLNSMAEADIDAAHAVVGQRVGCNEALADHPTIQVHVEDEQASVGLLGLLNGLFGAKVS